MNKSDLEKMQKCQEEYEKFLKESPLHSVIDEIAKDIRDRQDNVMAMEFTRTIAELLYENGIVIHCQKYEHMEDFSGKSIEVKYGVVFDSVDCVEHDRKFMDRIAELEKKISELESELSVKENLLKIKNGLCRENDLSELTPIKAADLIIENFKQGKYPIYERDSKGNIKYIDVDGEKYALETGYYRKYEEVRQIAEHLLVYCNHNSEED